MCPPHTMPCDNAQRYKDLLKIYKEHSSQLQTHASECLLEISPRPLKLDMANAKLFFFGTASFPSLSQMIPKLCSPCLSSYTVIHSMSKPQKHSQLLFWLQSLQL